MTTPTAYCLDCRHRDLDDERGALTCRKGHKPRFYAPRAPHDVNWGWKRRCADFELRVEETEE
jgi:hypothetical protein